MATTTTIGDNDILDDRWLLYHAKIFVEEEEKQRRKIQRNRVLLSQF